MREWTPHQLARCIRAEASKRAFTRKTVAVRAKVHPSQVSRIWRGDFRTVSKNVRKICKLLCISERPQVHMNSGLSEAICRVWNGTKRHEKSLLRLMDALSECAGQ